MPGDRALPCGAGAVVLREQVSLLLGGHPDPGIGHAQLRMVAVHARAQIHPPATARVLQSVGEQVPHRLLEPLRVQRQLGRLLQVELERDSRLLGAQREGLRRLLGDLGEPARSQCQLLRAGARHLIGEEILHDEQQLLGVAVGDLEIGGGLLRQVQIVLRELQVADHRGERGAQLVRDRCDEPLLRADRLDVGGDVREHHHRAGAGTVTVQHLPRRGGEHGALRAERADVHHEVVEGLLHHGPPHRTMRGRDRRGGARVAQKQPGLVGVRVAGGGGERVDPPLGPVHEHVVAVLVHDHHSHVHAVDDVVQQLLGRGRALQQRLLLAQHRGEAAVLPVHQAQPARHQQPHLQHSERQERPVGDGERVDVLGAHQGGHGDQRRGREH